MRNKKKRFVRCPDCGQKCSWKRTRDGRKALWGVSLGDWHWWGCPKQAKLRQAFYDERRRAEAFRSAVANG